MRRWALGEAGLAEHWRLWTGFGVHPLSLFFRKIFKSSCLGVDFGDLPGPSPGPVDLWLECLSVRLHDDFRGWGLRLRQAAEAVRGVQGELASRVARMLAAMMRAVWAGLVLVVGLQVGERGWGQSIVPGAKIARPEDITGIWEAPDGQGGVVGVNVEIDTRGEPGQDLRAPQEVELLAKVVFVRRKGSPDPVYAGFLYDPPDSLMEMSAHIWKLPTNVPEQLSLADRPEVDGWQGWMERGGQWKRVLLRRTSASQRPNPLVGTWRSAFGADCLHIAQGGDDAPIAWMDMLADMQRMRWAPGLKPGQIMERYGAPLKPAIIGSGFVMFETTSGMGMPRQILVRGTANGTRLLGDGTGVNPDWVRVRGASCRVP